MRRRIEFRNWMPSQFEDKKTKEKRGYDGGAPHFFFYHNRQSGRTLFLLSEIKTKSVSKKKKREKRNEGRHFNQLETKYVGPSQRGPVRTRLSAGRGKKKEITT